MIDIKTIQTLEFDKILRLISVFAVSEPGRRAVLDTVPVSDLFEAQRLLDTTEEMYAVYHKYNLAPMIPFDDVAEPLKKATAGATLQMAELLKVARLIRSARIAKKEIASSGEDIRYLKNTVGALFVEQDLETAITDAIASEYEMKDSASETLRSIRRKITAADGRLKEKLAGYTRTSNLSKYLQDSIVTIRNGRFVLPVKSECRSEIPGLIHDQSSSGATVFIEPLPVFELNNELRSLQLEEALEIERILRVLSDRVASCAQTLATAQAVCTMLDAVYAKMCFSADCRATKPILNDKGYVNLMRARHPLIDKAAVVPVDLAFGKDFRLLLITGPNTGGKTVCLKTAGLFCAMACAGIFLPCAEASIASVFDRIFCDIGDDQSIQNSLSTFSSHILNIASITKKLTNRSLILLDELGGGTDPAEGAALAAGVIQFLERAGACGIITTHYGELKRYAIASDRIENACMQFDGRTLKPTYKLLPGVPGASHALKISESLGVDSFILEKAYAAMDQGKLRFEDALDAAEQAKNDALAETERITALRICVEDELAAAQKERIKLKEKTERVNENARAEIKRLIGNAVDQANGMIQEMTALVKEADERALLEAKKLRSQIEELRYAHAVEETPQREYAPLDPGDIKAGMLVYARELGAEAEVISPPDKRGNVVLRAGGAQIKVHSTKLQAIKTPQTHQQESLNKTSRIRYVPQEKPTAVVNAAPTVQEIKVLGMTVSEAMEVIDEVIMTAIGRNVTVKIIHGKGTGALGKGIQGYLKVSKDILSVRYGGYGEGDRGVTFAEIR